MCLDEEQILFLIGGSLTATARAEAEEHLETCEACRHLVAAAVRTADSGGAGAPRSTLRRGASVGRYLILSRVGRGAMGEVFSAYDPELDRRVALKLLRTAPGAGSAGERLVREGRALGKLSHPNVVQVYDVGEHEGDVFIAMELVDGQSLDAWCQGPPRPGWQQVLAAYLDAARGLSAAHARGLVHRDVKPSNILRGKDGRVRVADFGLAAGSAGGGGDDGAPGEERIAPDPELAAGPGARAGDTLPLRDTAPAPVGGGGGLDEPLTETGALVGTPLYMAPEQHARSQGSPASDQYSLCAALYEGLHGVRPFTLAPGRGALRALLALKQAGVPASPPAGSPVPAWVHHALARGLAPDPRDRYPSLDALVAALAEDPTARRRARRRRAAIGVTVAALLAASAAGWVRSGAFADPCQHPERQLVGAWDETVRARVRAAFQGSGRSYAADTTTRVLALLDRYAADWGAMRGEVCQASRAGAPRREILALRDLCLDRRRGQLRALTTLFADRPDPQVVDRAVQAASDLYPIGYCADTEALSARVRPPESPSLRARVDALQPRADQLEALYEAGKYQDGLAIGEPLLAETGAIPYPPLLAQLQYWVGRLRDGAGDYEGAKTLLREASVSAADGRDEVLAALAWARLLYVVGERQQHLDEAAVIRALGPTVVAAAHDAQTRGIWLNAEGLALWRMGRYAEAKDAFDRCLVAYEQVSAPEASVAATVNNLGLVLNDMGDYPRALAAYERSLALREKALGPDHPYVAGSMTNLGNVLVNLGELRRAEVALERALGIRERALGPDHPDVGLALSNLGNALRARGDYLRALADLERARAILEPAMGPAHPNVALVMENLGDVHLGLGDYPQALALYEQSAAIWEKAKGPDHADLSNFLLGVGRTQVRLGRLDAARPMLERARAIREKSKGPDDPASAEPLFALGELSLARRAPEEAATLLERALSLHSQELRSETQLTLAEALWQVGKDRPRARAVAGEARAGFERLGHQPGLDRATRWLSDHPGGA